MGYSNYMPEYAIYEYGKNIKPVKVGWCWPAFFLTWIWALFSRQWILGIILFLIVVVLNYYLMTHLNEMSGKLWSSTLIFLGDRLIAGLWLGFAGNYYLAQHYLRGSYELAGYVQSDNAYKAIKEWKKYVARVPLQMRKQALYAHQLK